MRAENQLPKIPRAGAEPPAAVQRSEKRRWGWRPVGTVGIFGLTLLLGWHVFNGKNGVSSWQQKRAEDKQLQQEINSLQGENARLRERVSRLETDSDMIAQVAHEKLHYTKPNEIIVNLPQTGNGK